MQSRNFSGQLAVLLLLASSAVATGQPPKQDTPQPLPAEIVAAWKKAGAKPGSMGLDLNGFLAFEEKATGLVGAVPVFSFASWKDGVVAKLPVPAALFGLNLYRTQVTDAGLKELAGLKSLHTLDLRGTQVTDAGLKELAGLKSLHTLYLSGTQVTDAGVAELQKALPDCRINRLK